MRPMKLWDRFAVSWRAFRIAFNLTKMIPKDQIAHEEKLMADGPAKLKAALESLDVLDRAMVLGINPIATPEMIVEAVEKIPDFEGRFWVMQHIAKRDPEIVTERAFQRWSHDNRDALMARHQITE